MEQTSFYTKSELVKLGFKSLGENVLISRKASIYGTSNIEIGSNVRIDDFVTVSISKSLKIGSYVHIGVYASIIGAGEIIISDFCGLSGRVSIYSSSDDYSGAFLTNPMVDSVYRNVNSAPVVLGKHVIIGCGAAIMPGVSIGEGASIGAMSLVLENCESNYIYAGNPLKKIIPKFKKYKKLEEQFLKCRK